MSSRRSWPWLLLVAGLLALCGPLARGDDEAEPEEIPDEVPVAIEAEVDESEAADLGRYVVRLAFLPEEDVTRAYRIELRLSHRSTTILNLDHSPDVPTTQWRKGQAVRYEVPFPLPLEAGLEPGDRLDLLLSFRDPEIDQSVPPRVDSGLWGLFLPLAHLVVPELTPTDDDALIEKLLAKSRELAEADRRPDAWRLLELAIRRAEEDPTKERFRDGILALGHFAPRSISVLEAQRVKQRIAAEKRRYLREKAGHFYDRGKLYAALRILEAVGGALSEEADAAVIGALAAAQRTKKDIQEIRLRLLARVTEEDKAEARKAVEKLGLDEKLYAQAEAWFADKAWAKARYCYRELSLVSDRDMATRARQRMEELDAAWLGETPPKQAVMVDDVVNHAAFGRLATVASHNFIYIGPKILVENIPALSRDRYDLGFVFLTDLFGRVPNPNGARITVFFKELWRFGGGRAGGDKIDIGSADKDRRGYRVDTGLLYHELTHCIDDTVPIFVGHREGLANMGAAYLFEALDQEGDSTHAFHANLKAFREDYLNRDLAYWRIPSYGPSAGFFLHFLEKYAAAPWGHDWKPYRHFFRAYRDAPVRDGREPYVARAYAWYLMQVFGGEAFDDLLRFRWPLVESDRKAVGVEVEAFVRGEHRVPRDPLEYADFPNSPLPRDLVTRRLLGRVRGGARGQELIDRTRRELGILHDWWVIGPFRSKGADPRVHVFPPEYEIDFAKEYLSGNNMCKWRKAGESLVVSAGALGWIGFNFSYQENTATYALCHVTVDRDLDAFAHLRSDDDFVLWVNDERVESYLIRGHNGSSRVWWRGPTAPVPDAMRLPIRLHAGRNKILVKVKNRSGKAGFVMALSRTDGVPISGLVGDLEPPDLVEEESKRPKVSWKSVVKHSFRTKAFKSKLEPTVGDFKVVNRRLTGTSKAKQVAWRQYTVRPGFSKDSPSNLIWIKGKYTEELDDFRLELDLAPAKGGVPKLVVTFQGEGEDDALSGWNLIVHPRRKKVGVQLERYDHIVYQTTPLDPPGGEVQPLVLTYLDRRLTVTLGDLTLLDGMSILPIPGKHRIGLATFGPDLGLESFNLKRPTAR